MAIEKKKTPPHYRLFVSGTYSYTGSHDNTDKDCKKVGFYEMVVPVPISTKAVVPTKEYDDKGRVVWADIVKTVRTEDMGLLSYILKSKLIQARLMKIHPSLNITCLLSHTLNRIEGSDPSVVLPTDPMVLGRKQLEDLIHANGWPITIALYSNVKELRAAVLNYKEHPPSFEKLELLLRRRKASLTAFRSAQSELDDIYEDTSDASDGHTTHATYNKSAKNPTSTDPPKDMPI